MYKRQVIYLSDKYADTWGTRASKRMLNAAGVKLTKLSLDHDSLTINFKEELV